MLLLDEEYFGLLLKVICYIDFDDVICEVNNISFGLLVGLFVDSEEDYYYFFVWIWVGIVNWNCFIIGVSSVVFFGGVGDSGNYCVSVFYVVDYCVYFVVFVELDKVMLSGKFSLGLFL